MSHRSGIANKIVKDLAWNLDGTGDYINNVNEHVQMGNVNFQDINQWPLITVSPGPEMRKYLPAGVSQCTLNIYIRVYVRDDNDSQEMVESLISDIETYLDNNLDLTYNVNTPTGEQSHKTVTNTIISINTSEGLLSPDEIGEIAVEIRYDKIRGIN